MEEAFEKKELAAVADLFPPQGDWSEENYFSFRIEKFVEYAKAGVNEYWIVEPQEKAIEVYVLIEGAYTVLGKYGSGQSARSRVLFNLEVLVDEVFLPANLFHELGQELSGFALNGEVK